MIGLVVRVLINALALWITTKFVPEIGFGSSPSLAGVVGVAIVFGLVNSFIKPVVKVMTFPITLLTLGLFGLLVNGLLLLFVAAMSSAFGLTFTVGGFPPEFGLNSIWWAIVGSVVLGIVSALLGLLPFGDS